MISLNPSGFACGYNPDAVDNLVRDKGGKKQYTENRSRRGRFYNVITCLHFHKQIKTFWTFTIPELQTNYPVTDKIYTSKFKRLCEYLRLRYNRGLQNGFENFVWVSEAQKRGNIHFHLVTSSDYIDIKWVNDYWTTLIGQESKNAVDVQIIKSEYVDRETGEIIDNSIRNVSGYFAKYLSKNHNKTETENLKSRVIHSRSFGYSRNFPILPKVKMHESDFFKLFPDAVPVSKQVAEDIEVNYFFLNAKETWGIIAGTAYTGTVDTNGFI
jgi:hypothetical protein